MQFDDLSFGHGCTLFRKNKGKLQNVKQKNRVTLDNDVLGIGPSSDMKSLQGNTLQVPVQWSPDSSCSPHSLSMVNYIFTASKTRPKWKIMWRFFSPLNTLPSVLQAKWRVCMTPRPPCVPSARLFYDLESCRTTWSRRCPNSPSYRSGITFRSDCL